jgi:hypothetical protein
VAVFARASSIDRAENGLRAASPTDRDLLVNSYCNRPEFISREFGAAALYLPLNLALVRDIVAADVMEAPMEVRGSNRATRATVARGTFCLPDPSKTASWPRWRP